MIGIPMECRASQCVPGRAENYRVAGKLVAAEAYAKFLCGSDQCQVFLISVVQIVSSDRPTLACGKDHSRSAHARQLNFLQT
jgi:hypothetical protein